MKWRGTLAQEQIVLMLAILLFAAFFAAAAWIPDRPKPDHAASQCCRSRRAGNWNGHHRYWPRDRPFDRGQHGNLSGLDISARQRACAVVARHRAWARLRSADEPHLWNPDRLCGDSAALHNTGHGNIHLRLWPGPHDPRH